MSLEVKIVGFDKASERISSVLMLPSAVFERVKGIAGVPSSDPEIVGSYPLTPEQVASIADVAHVTIDPGRFDYFLEADEVASHAA